MKYLTLAVIALISNTSAIKMQQSKDAEEAVKQVWAELDSTSLDTKEELEYSRAHGFLKSNIDIVN